MNTDARWPSLDEARARVLEIQTELYPKLPGGTYVRMLFITGDGNTLKGLTVRNTGPQQGTSGRSSTSMSRPT